MGRAVLKGKRVRKAFMIKPMTRSEVDLAVDWAAQEGWNPGLDDGGVFFQTDPQGFLIGYLDTKPVGCISAVSYSNGFGFVGFYIVIPEFRGKGYGIQLWQAAMKRLSNHTIGLDGVVEQQDNYKKSGFQWAYANIRFEWPALTDLPVRGENIIGIQAVPFADLEAYDRRCFPSGRAAFLKAWISGFHCFGVGFVKSGVLGGYGVIRKCRQGFKIGPLFADDQETAEKIFLKLVSFADRGQLLFIDIPEVNPQGIQLAEKYGMKKVFETARMYAGDFPVMETGKIFGVTTFELG